MRTRLLLVERAAPRGGGLDSGRLGALPLHQIARLGLDGNRDLARLEGRAHAVDDSNGLPILGPLRAAEVALVRELGEGALVGDAPRFVRGVLRGRRFVVLLLRVVVVVLLGILVVLLGLWRRRRGRIIDGRRRRPKNERRRGLVLERRHALVVVVVVRGHLQILGRRRRHLRDCRHRHEHLRRLRGVPQGLPELLDGRVHHVVGHIGVAVEELPARRVAIGEGRRHGGLERLQHLGRHVGHRPVGNTVGARGCVTLAAA